MARIAIRLCCAVAVLVFVAAAGRAGARDSGGDWPRCKAADPNVAIAGCSAVLGSGAGSPAELADAAIRRAYAYSAKQRYDRALADFDEAARLDPGSADAFAGRGFTNQNLGHENRAIRDFDVAIRMRPSFYAAFVGRATAEFAVRRYDGAIADFGQAIALWPRNSSVLAARGRAYDAKGDYDRAIADFDAAIRLDPSNAVVYDRRGITFVSKGDYDHAIADYDAAIQRNPRYADAFNDRGVAYFRKADYDQAIADATQAIAIKPNFAAAFVNRAEAYERKHDHDRAIVDFSRALALNPRDVEALDHRGHALVRTAQYDRAIADYSQALHLDPNDVEAFNDRGVAYFDKREFRRSIADFGAAIRLNPSYTQALVNRGHSYVNVNDYDDAIADYSAAIRLDRGNPALFKYRGTAYQRRGDPDRAIADYSEAIRLRPDYAVAFADRGNAYSAKHDYDLAIADYDEAIRLDPFEADAFAGRGLVYMQTGQTERGAGDLRAALRLDSTLVAAHFGLSVIAFARYRDYRAAIDEIDAILKLSPGNMTVRYARGLYELFDGKYQASVTDFALANWYTLSQETVGGAPLLAMVLVVAIIGLAAATKPRFYWPMTVRSLIRHTGDVMRLVALRSKRLAFGAVVPFVISVGAALGAVPLDRFWDALWLRMGVPTTLVPASGSTIVFGLCLQAFAVYAHRIAGEASAEAGFWSAYGRFNAYAVTLFATGYFGLVAAAYILSFYGQTLLQYHLLNIPVFWLAFSVIALAGVLILGLIARCSLMLPAAALGRPLSPAGAWRLQRGSTSQLSLVASLCAVLGAVMIGLARQALAHIPSSVMAPRLHEEAAAVAAQFSLYFATALIAATLSLFYRERMAAARVTSNKPTSEASLRPPFDES